MRKGLYVNEKAVVYRIFDPVEGKFCRSGRGLYARNGRSVWDSKSGASSARSCMPNKDRLVIKEFELTETRNELPKV